MLTPVTKNHVRQYKPGAFKDAEGFGIRKNGKVTRINAYDVEKQLRQLPSAKFNAASKYIVASKMTNSDIRLRLDSRLNGGLAGGATVGWWAGWLGVNVIAEAGILLASAGVGTATTLTTGNPWAGWAAGKASAKVLNYTLQPHIQAYAQSVALGTGILVGSTTPI